jgi:phage shock protein A
VAEDTGSPPAGAGATSPPEDASVTPPPEDAAAQVPTPVVDAGYTESGVPTLEGVREKIETRYGTALGHTELASETSEARAAAESYEKRQRAAAEKLEEIRDSMRDADESG